jgi:hypothetical protein
MTITLFSARVSAHHPLRVKRIVVATVGAFSGGALGRSTGHALIAVVSQALGEGRVLNLMSKIAQLRY